MTKGKFAVIDFKIYKISCSWRYENVCGTYGRENEIICDRKNCPFVLYFFDEILKEEPYKIPKIDYVV